MTVRRLGSLAVVLLVAGLAFGQGVPKKDPKEPPRPSPGSLEDTLEKALRNSADIKAAEAKVRDAEAGLNRVRHQVLTKATALYSDLTLAKRMLALAERTFELQQKVNSPQADLIAAQTAIERHRGEVDKLEAELKALRGEFAIKGILNLAFDPDGRRIAGTTADGTVRVWDTASGMLLTDLMGQIEAKAPASAVKGSMAERVRKLLDQEVEFQSELRADQALHGLMETAKSDIPVRVLLAHEVQAQFVLKGKLPIGAWLQAIEDSDPQLSIVVRDYGLLLTNKDRVPTGAVGVSELWKARKPEPNAEPNGPGLDKK